MKYSTIETDRIVLRFLTHNDIDDMLLYRNNINVSKYQGFEPNYTKESMREFINTYSTEKINPKVSWIQIGIEYNNKIIGDIGIHIENIGCDYHQAQVGITLNPDYQGKGIAYEAMNVLIKFLFLNWSCHRIYGEIDDRNIKSINLFKKLNFRQEAHFINNYYFKNEWTSVFIYAILNE